MNVLVLGGTQFVGYAIAAAAVERGWTVTTVSRGDSGEPPAGVTWHRVDRRDPAALTSLPDGPWDLVFDTWSDEPAVVAASASHLAERSGWYGFVSTRSVYAAPLRPGSDESAPAVSPNSEFEYAANKRGSELAVEEHFPGRHLILRPGLIFGPREDTGRLTWWLNRAASGGSMVAPMPKNQPWQYIDARDLAAFMLAAGERSVTGTMNVVCPLEAGVTTERLIDACVSVTGSRANPVWVPVKTLTRAGVRDWDDLPGWIAPGSDLAGLHDCDVSRAMAAGLSCRSIEATVTETWEWMQSLPRKRSRSMQPGLPRRGLTAEQEQSIWWLTSA